MKDKLFVDTNVLLNLLSHDINKADAAEAMLNKGGIISVQMLIETTQVLRRKVKPSWSQTHDFLLLLTSSPTSILREANQPKGTKFDANLIKEDTLTLSKQCVRIINCFWCKIRC